MAARPGDLERRDAEVAEDRLVARDRELGADEHHVHRQPAAAALDEQLLGRRQHLGRGLRPGAYASRKAWKPSVLIRTLSRTDSSSVVALDRARVVELDVPRDELRRAGERARSRATVIT